MNGSLMLGKLAGSKALFLDAHFLRTHRVNLPFLLSPSNPQAYRDRGLEPNVRNTETDSAKEKLLHAMLDNAKARGWEIFIFAPGSGATGAKPLPLAEDPYGAVGMAAVWDETFGSFPQVDGGIMDGWTESAYELEWHHGNAVFADIP